MGDAKSCTPCTVRVGRFQRRLNEKVLLTISGFSCVQLPQRISRSPSGSSGEAASEQLTSAFQCSAGDHTAQCSFKRRRRSCTSVPWWFPVSLFFFLCGTFGCLTPELRRSVRAYRSAAYRFGVPPGPFLDPLL